MNPTTLPHAVLVGRTYRTHNHPTRFWETSVMYAHGDLFATAYGETQEESENAAAWIVSALNAKAEGAK